MPVWQEAIAIAEKIYQLSDNFPTSEQIGLCSQMRRASVSVFSNIAEGFGRDGKQEKRRFYVIARASMFELESQLFFAQRIQLITIITWNELTGLIVEWLFSVNKLIKAFSI